MIKELTEDSFEMHPVWMWDETTEWHVPVPQYEPLPRDLGTLFISARFESNDGHRFKGYLIGIRSYYAFGLFVGNKVHVFNLNLRDMIDQSLKEISRDLGGEELQLFPLEYETSLHFEGQPNISGTFS